MVDPHEMLWRQFRREVTRCELSAHVQALLAATRTFFDCYNQQPGEVRSVLGAHPA